MGKQFDVSDTEIDQSEPAFGDLEEFEFDDDAFFEQYSKHSKRTNKRSIDARRKIEQWKENRELKQRLRECYYDDDY